MRAASGGTGWVGGAWVRFVGGRHGRSARRAGMSASACSSMAPKRSLNAGATHPRVVVQPDEVAAGAAARLAVVHAREEPAGVGARSGRRALWAGGAAGMRPGLCGRTGRRAARGGSLAAAAHQPHARRIGGLPDPPTPHQGSGPHPPHPFTPSFPPSHSQRTFPPRCGREAHQGSGSHSNSPVCR